MANMEVILNHGNSVL